MREVSAFQKSRRKRGFQPIDSLWSKWTGASVPKSVLGMRGALVADPQVLAEIESREYSLITSNLNTDHSCGVLSQFGDFSVFHSPKFAAIVEGNWPSSQDCDPSSTEQGK